MGILRNIFKQHKPADPIFPGENFSIIRLNMKDGLAKIEIIDSNENGHPGDEEALQLNAIQDEIELLLKKQHTVHSIARVTRNGYRDIMIYIDKPKSIEEQLSDLLARVRENREVIFSIERDRSYYPIFITTLRPA